ncbi:dolichyl-phosphate-mannose--protein mannosyltransferase [Demequina aurantiaca]|uniref:dolichyl-phosphate-mannose--protein mannosyltransferase n=1 Tax=Demequina aurantiaca TaxID=676200 RepID=UPI003D34ECA9
MTFVWRWRVALMASSVGIIASMLRFTALGWPKALVFDEVFYVRGGFSLATLGYEGNWTGENDAFAQGDLSGLEAEGDFVVHPMVGKLFIALGIQIFGNNPFGWRVMGALLGVIMCVMLAFIARHLLRSTLWGMIAGLFLAVDGQGIVLARTGLLDIYLAFFAVAGFGALLVDRHVTRRKLAERAADARAAAHLAPGAKLPGMGPGLGIRWWRWVAILMFAMAGSVKWSGFYFAAAFLLLSVAWDLLDRRSAGVQRWAWGGLLRAVPAGLLAIASTLVVYTATWFPWFMSNDSYGRHWAQANPGKGTTWLPDSLNSLVHYHLQMWKFHENLTTEHTYMSNPWFWPLQWRPTAFFFENAPDAACGAERCVSAVHALGNPLIWWAGSIALGYAIYRMIRHRDMLALTVSLGAFAAWLPWLPYAYRTIFTFYTIAMAPFLVLTLIWALKNVAQPDRLRGGWSRGGTIVALSFVGAVLVISGFFAPLWLGTPIPFAYWQAHMWLPSWV